MVSNKLKTAAEAAGYAMVNPEDFAGDPKPRLEREAPARKSPEDEQKHASTSRWWPSLDMFSLTGGKAPA